MTNTITINRTTSCWTATYSGPHAAMIADLFGSTTVPTAFTSAASASDVIAKLTKSNPGVEIRQA